MIVGDLDYLQAKLRVNGGSLPQSFMVFCSVLLPLLPAKFRTELLSAWWRVPGKWIHNFSEWIRGSVHTGKQRLRSFIGSISGMFHILKSISFTNCSSLSAWVHGLVKQPLKKTLTDKVENGTHQPQEGALDNRNSTQNLVAPEITVPLESAGSSVSERQSL
jgi:hypothetical protein